MLYKQIGLVCVLLFNKTVQYKTARQLSHRNRSEFASVDVNRQRAAKSHWYYCGGQRRRGGKSRNTSRKITERKKTTLFFSWSLLWAHFVVLTWAGRNRAGFYWIESIETQLNDLKLAQTFQKICIDDILGVRDAADFLWHFCGWNQFFN